jgi:fibronectin type 3 domain-containing protein
MKFFFKIMLLFLSSYCFAQNNNILIKLLSYNNGQSIKLRWAPTSPESWEMLIKYGFRLERYTISFDNELIDNHQAKVLVDHYTPVPLEEWMNDIVKDEYAAIAAQCIYGEKTIVQVNSKDPILNVIDQSNDVQQRYTLSLLATDMSFMAAKLSAFGYEDTTIQKGYRYAYRLISLVPNSICCSDTVVEVIRVDEVNHLPKLKSPNVVFSDSAALINYNYFMYKDVYNAFNIERSVDGGLSFIKINKKPIVAMNIKNHQEAYQIYYTDILDPNYDTFQYRIKGINSFSEEGPASENCIGKRIKKFSSYPHIVNSTIMPDQTVLLKWEFDMSSVNSISGFEIRQSIKHDGPYQKIDFITDAYCRQYVVRKLFSTNYFTVVAVSKIGEQHESPKQFVQLIDSIPPNAPQFFKGYIDSLDRVCLNWEQNKEVDFLGYKVFRANHIKEEPYPISDTIIYETMFKDSIFKSLGNRSIIYYIKAFDTHYNESQLSEPLILKRIDKTPPTSPLFKSYAIKEDGVLLNWINSYDEDVRIHQLVRKGENGKWLVLKDFKDSTSSFFDKTVKQGELYTYVIFAIDESNLYSEPINPIKVKMISKSEDLKVNDFKANIDLTGDAILLQWSYVNNKSVLFYELYRGKDDHEITFYKNIEGNCKSFHDQIKVGSSYEYAIRPVFKNGMMGSFVYIKW